MVSDLRSSRGELYAALLCLSVCEAGGSGSEELRKCPPLPLQSCDSWMFVKENPDRKKVVCFYQNHKFNSKNKENKMYGTGKIPISWIATSESYPQNQFPPQFSSEAVFIRCTPTSSAPTETNFDSLNFHPEKNSD